MCRKKKKCLWACERRKKTKNTKEALTFFGAGGLVGVNLTRGSTGSQGHGEMTSFARTRAVRNSIGVIARGGVVPGRRNGRRRTRTAILEGRAVGTSVSAARFFRAMFAMVTVFTLAVPGGALPMTRTFVTSGLGILTGTGVTFSGTRAGTTTTGGRATAAGWWALARRRRFVDFGATMRRRNAVAAARNGAFPRSRVILVSLAWPAAGLVGLVGSRVERSGFRSELADPGVKAGVSRATEGVINGARVSISSGIRPITRSGEVVRSGSRSGDELRRRSGRCRRNLDDIVIDLKGVDVSLKARGERGLQETDDRRW
jgi:hypothetical protein